MKIHFISDVIVLGLLLTFASKASAQDHVQDKGLIAQSTYQCGIVPIKPIVPVQCDDLEPVCNTSTNQWEWMCVKKNVYGCGIKPIKPIVPVRCEDLQPVCDENAGEWHWLCVTKD